MYMCVYILHTTMVTKEEVMRLRKSEEMGEIGVEKVVEIM